jgi:hypothetical protein
MAVIDGIGLAEPSTITKSLAAVLIQRNSSDTYQEVMVIGSPNSTTSSALAEVTNAAAASTAWGLVTRTRTAPESTAWASSAGFHFDSSGALTANIVGGQSTTVNVSSLGGAVIVRSSAANALVTAYQSTAADLQATVTLASTAMQVQARPMLPTLISLGSTAGTDTTVTLISSAATTPRIVAFHVSSTEAGPIRAGFYAGSTLLWPITLWADGGVVNVSGAVAAPAYLFSGQADRPVQFSASSTGAFFVGLTYFQQ